MAWRCHQTRDGSSPTCLRAIPVLACHHLLSRSSPTPVVHAITACRLSSSAFDGSPPAAMTTSSDLPTPTITPVPPPPHLRLPACRSDTLLPLCTLFTYRHDHLPTALSALPSTATTCYRLPTRRTSSIRRICCRAGGPTQRGAAQVRCAFALWLTAYRRAARQNTRLRWTPCCRYNAVRFDLLFARLTVLLVLNVRSRNSHSTAAPALIPLAAICGSARVFCPPFCTTSPANTNICLPYWRACWTCYLRFCSPRDRSRSFLPRMTASHV